MPSTRRTTPSSPATHGAFPASHLTISASAAIFHLASARVVVCRHSVEGHWFLPKGRRDVGERTERAAEREGFEEAGFRNRVLPVPFAHCQTRPAGGAGGGEVEFTTEAIWMQLLPLAPRHQYVLYWFVAETVPREVEEMYREGGALAGTGHRPPPEYPPDMTLRQRIDLDRIVAEDGTTTVYEPVRHEGTGVDSDELMYESYLLPIEEACQRLRGSVMDEVIRSAWAAIQYRLSIES